MAHYGYNLNESLHHFDNERRQWENAINCYRGNDPLNLWWRYICWLEQNIHLDTENQFRKSLEQCLSVYENYDGYKNDVRMIKLWIKYIDMQSNQPQLFQMLYQRGIGTQLAAFYIAWAHYFDSAGAFKQAESIFNLALQTNAQPYEVLKAAQNKFLMSVAQRMLYNDGSSKKRSADNLAEQRQQITTLNTNAAVKKPKDEEEEVVETTNEYYSETQSQPVYQTVASYDITPPTLNNSANVISSSLNFVYDETKTEDNDQIDLTRVYDFEAGAQLPKNHVKTAKNHHEMWHVSLFLDEPFENKRCFYQRALVYPGDGTEYSPEEIRARRWYRRLEEIKERKRLMQQKQEEERIQLQQERQKQALKQEQEEKRRKLEQEKRQQEIDAQEQQRKVYMQNTYSNYVQSSYSVKPQSDDIEDQIEASTISFSAGNDGANKRITIKFKKEKTVELHEISSTPTPVTPVTLPPANKAPSGRGAGGSSRKKQKVTVLSSYDQKASHNFQHNGGNNGYKSQVEDANLLLSLSHHDDASATGPPDSINDDSYSSFSNENSSSQDFNGFCSTPIRNSHSVASSKTSTPVSTNRLRKQGTNLSYLNDDSMSSYTENSYYQVEDEETKKKRYEKALQTIETHMKRTTIDPFNTELCKAFLTKLDFPSQNTENCHIMHGYLARFFKGQDLTLGNTEYYVDREVGKGAYGSVYKALNKETNEMVALKYQKPANSWEFYICQEVRKRCKSPDMLHGFMHVSLAVVAPNCTVFVSEFSSYGSLLDINNKFRTATTRVMHESLVMHFSYQILSIVQYLHSCKIIHADIKPDNFLLMKPPNIDSNQPTLRLIDFGCAIDMNLFKEGTEFTKVIQTDGFTCIEMMEGRPWSYQTDLFCVAGTIHVMLFGEYMSLNKAGAAWEIKNKLPRYLKKQVWTEIFNKLLNIKDINHLPDLNKLKGLLDNEIWSMESELNANIRTLKNLVKPTTIKRTNNRRTMNKSNMHNTTITNLDNNSTLIATCEDSESQPGV